MATEMRGFVFSIVFIIVFSTMLSTIPTGLQGAGESPDTVTPIDPSLVTGFSAFENYTTSSFTTYIPPQTEIYDYTLGAYDWRCSTDNTTYFILRQKVLIFGFLWLGHTIDASFVTQDGLDRGPQLSYSEIEADDDDGGVRYSLELDSGDSGGSFVVFWNTTAYPTVANAWGNDTLYLLHGIGFSSSATADIGSLLVSLLFLQIPGVPVLVNMFLAVPLWACIVYVLWFVIKEMIPFL